MLSIALGFSASVCWGIGDFLGGLTTRRLPGIVVAAASQAVGVCALIVVVGLEATRFPGMDALLPAVLAGGASALGIVSLYRALAIGLMSIVAPIAAASAAVPVIVGIIQGDRPSSWQIAGMALTGIGILLAARSNEPDRERKSRLRESVLLALMVACLLGFVLIGLHLAAEKGPFWAVLFARLTTVIALGMIILTTRARRPALVTSARVLAAIGILDVSAACCYALASTNGLLSVAGVSASLFPVVTVVLARVVLDERLCGVQRVGMISALLGIALLAVG